MKGVCGDTFYVVINNQILEYYKHPDEQNNIPGLADGDPRKIRYDKVLKDFDPDNNSAIAFFKLRDKLNIIALIDSERDFRVFVKNNAIGIPSCRALDNLFGGNERYVSFDPFFISFDKTKNSFFIIHRCSKDSNGTHHFLNNFVRNRSL
ncbi:MAG: hypothetical protein LBS52_09810 [Dysgonamonadaceae bacterium]|nr:hypothetical protein [Dysgonamonadaceae bacterium]